jgi:hypothetical protein
MDCISSCIDDYIVTIEKLLDDDTERQLTTGTVSKAQAETLRTLCTLTFHCRSRDVIFEAVTFISLHAQQKQQQAPARASGRLCCCAGQKCQADCLQ